MPKLQPLFKIALVMLSVLYPILVCTCLVLLHLPLRLVSLLVIFVALVFFVTATGSKNRRFLVSALVLLAAGAFCLLTGSSFFLKLYPVCISGIFLAAFGYTLFSPPSMVFRFAIMMDRRIPGSLAESRVKIYCRRVTVIWCAFFVLNGSLAFVTVLSDNDILWSIYNGGLSYLLMGMLFAGEYIVRRFVNKKMPKAVPFSKFKASSRPGNTVLCYERRWSDGKKLTWDDFLGDSAKMRAFIRCHDDVKKWILHCDDYWYFLVCFAALLQCKKEILLTANTSPAFVAEMREQAGCPVCYLTDSVQSDSFLVPDLLDSAPRPDEQEKASTPAIDADSTSIIMYTSGTTGQPKLVHQRLTEFEEDNAFVLSRWGEEFLKRRLCSTVSQHHIYGLLFTVLIPFTLGLPFRRKRIEFADEFRALDDDSYMIIAVPAFLKRTVQEGMEKLPLHDPWIFTSGGLLTPELAKRTDEVFGFWPLEVYGSTETSGIAWRQSRQGLEWTPFDNAQIWKNEAGCLVIKSPYIRDPAGFATGDLVEIHDDGRFILKGRADSIVKIEEKRISLPEVEARLAACGLVSDLCVVAMEDRRQYLAAALVLNSAGRAQFAGKKKFEINRWFHDYLMQYFENVVIPKKWRFLDAIPMDVQGKKKKLEIQALFKE